MSAKLQKNKQKQTLQSIMSFSWSVENSASAAYNCTTASGFAQVTLGQTWPRVAYSWAWEAWANLAKKQDPIFTCVVVYVNIM